MAQGPNIRLTGRTFGRTVNNDCLGVTCSVGLACAPGPTPAHMRFCITVHDGIMAWSVGAGAVFKAIQGPLHTLSLGCRLSEVAEVPSPVARLDL